MCKSIVGVDATQLFPHPMFQLKPNRRSTRWDVDSETSRVTSRHKRPVALKKLSYYNFNDDRVAKLMAFAEQAEIKKWTATVLTDLIFIA